MTDEEYKKNNGKLVSTPCPFCDHDKAKLYPQRVGSHRRTGTNWQVVCNKCRGRGPLDPVPAEAERRWRVIGKNPKLNVSIYDIHSLASAVDTVSEYHTDNSCGDPDCCTSFAPSEEDYRDAKDTLANLGLELEVYRPVGE